MDLLIHHIKRNLQFHPTSLSSSTATNNSTQRSIQRSSSSIVIADDNQIMSNAGLRKHDRRHRREQPQSSAQSQSQNRNSMNVTVDEPANVSDSDVDILTIQNHSKSIQASSSSPSTIPSKRTRLLWSECSDHERMQAYGDWAADKAKGTATVDVFLSYIQSGYHPTYVYTVDSENVDYITDSSNSQQLSQSNHQRDDAIVIEQDDDNSSEHQIQLVKKIKSFKNNNNYRSGSMPKALHALIRQCSARREDFYLLNNTIKPKEMRPDEWKHVPCHLCNSPYYYHLVKDICTNARTECNIGRSTNSYIPVDRCLTCGRYVADHRVHSIKPISSPIIPNPINNLKSNALTNHNTVTTSKRRTRTRSPSSSSPEVSPSISENEDDKDVTVPSTTPNVSSLSRMVIHVFYRMNN